MGEVVVEWDLIVQLGEVVFAGEKSFFEV